MIAAGFGTRLFRTKDGNVTLVLPGVEFVPAETDIELHRMVSADISIHIDDVIKADIVFHLDQQSIIQAVPQYHFLNASTKEVKQIKSVKFDDDTEYIFESLPVGVNRTTVEDAFERNDPQFDHIEAHRQSFYQQHNRFPCELPEGKE